MDGTYFCSNTSECISSSIYVECNGHCICAPSYTWSETRKRCLTHNVAKALCSSVEDCVDNSAAAACIGRCSCREGYYYDLEEFLCTKLSSWTCYEIYFFAITSASLIGILIWSMIKDSFESRDTQYIKSLIQKEYLAYCRSLNPSIAQQSRTNIESNESIVKEKNSESFSQQPRIEKALLWDKINTCNLVVNTFLGSHELVKIFFFSSKIITRTGKAIVFALQIQSALCIFILFKNIFKSIISPVYLILLCFYGSLPIKWVTEYFLRYCCDTTISERLVSRNPLAEISLILGNRFAIQSKIKCLGTSLGFILIFIFTASTVFLLYLMDSKYLYSTYFYMYLQLVYNLTIHQGLVALSQLILLKIYGSSYTISDFQSPPFCKSFIMREIIEVLSR